MSVFISVDYSVKSRNGRFKTPAVKIGPAGLKHGALNPVVLWKEMDKTPIFIDGFAVVPPFKKIFRKIELFVGINFNNRSGQ